MNNDNLRLSIVESDTSTSQEIPMATSGVAAGFPSPADDYMDNPLDLNKTLIRNPSATFFARVDGHSMKDMGIADGDLLVVDKSIEPSDGCVAVCFLDGEFTLKRVCINADGVVLMPANDAFKPIIVNSDSDFTVWGVVSYCIKKIGK